MTSRGRIELARAVESIARDQPAWPRRLADLDRHAAPAGVLYLGGVLPPLERAVAVVGTRYADRDGIAFTEEIAGQIAAAGCTVISGGAEGIDAAAHRGALAAGGATVAVLATGLERAYPAHHATLFARIAEQGALLCEEISPRRVQRFAFLRRNRLVAALAETVLVVQAPARSGAASTAGWARKLGRRLAVVPSAPWDVRGQGCLALLRSGAQICTSVTDILSVPAARAPQGHLPGLAFAGKHKHDEGLPEPARAVWQLLTQGPQHPDRLSAWLDMPVARVQEALLTLLLRGRVTRRIDGAYETTRSQ